MQCFDADCGVRCRGHKTGDVAMPVILCFHYSMECQQCHTSHKATGRRWPDDGPGLSCYMQRSVTGGSSKVYLLKPALIGYGLNQESPMTPLKELNYGALVLGSRLGMGHAKP